MSETRCIFVGTTSPRVLPDRHLSACEECDCPGCVECPEAHCWDCGDTHLQNEHPLTCPRCLGRHRSLLDDLAEHAESLTDRMVDHAQDGIPGSNRILGGNALVLLGLGSEGAYWTADHTARLVPTYACTCGVGGIVEPSRHLLERHCPPEGGPRWLADASMFTLEGERVVEPQGNDNYLTDPQSVLFALERVEDDWRDALGKPPTEVHDLAGTVAFLGRHIHWAAQRIAGHDGAWYPDSIEELRSLRGRLVAELGDADPTIRGVSCLELDCGGTLLRPFDPADPCDHRSTVAAQAILDARSRIIGPLTRAAMRTAVTDALSFHACDQGGRRDKWVCSGCPRKYDLDEYNQAVAQLHLDQNPLRTAGQLREMYGIKPASLRWWVLKGEITQHKGSDDGCSCGERHDGMRSGWSLYDANEVREQAQRGGLLAG